MNIWILVVMLYSPGGSLISTTVEAYNTFQECVDQASAQNKEQHPMNIKTKAICKKVTV